MKQNINVENAGRHQKGYNTCKYQGFHLIDRECKYISRINLHH